MTFENDFGRNSFVATFTLYIDVHVVIELQLEEIRFSYQSLIKNYSVEQH